MGIALGALLAATVPPTRREDELMGQKSDELTGKLKHKAREGYEMASAEGEHLASQVKHDLSAITANRPHGRTDGASAGCRSRGARGLESDRITSDNPPRRRCSSVGRAAHS